MDASQPPGVFLTVEAVDGRAPTLEEAAGQLGLSVEGLDEEIGVLLVDPAAGTYCVQVNGEPPPARTDRRGTYRGPFSAPRIAGMGSPGEAPARQQEPPDEES